jgi:hypothetical protein
MLLRNCISTRLQSIVEGHTKNILELRLQTLNIELPHFHNSQPGSRFGSVGVRIRK